MSINSPIWKLRSWIDYNNLDCNSLSINKKAISLLSLKENKDKINWYYLSLNTESINILKENQDKIHWKNLIGWP